ncbi:MAG: FAD-binding oxidoreductase, partial [Acidobacteria bacterium]
MKSTRDPRDLEPYLTDESRIVGSADELVWPETAEEVAAVLARAHAEGVPVTVSGAGTGVVGGRVPQGGIILALDRMAGVVSCAATQDGGTMRVLPGTPLATVQQEAARHGLLYPPDPTETGASIGGNIATNASGSRSFRFGSTRRWITRLRVALADGTLLDLPRGAVCARNGRFVVPRPGKPDLVVPAPDWAPPATSKHVVGYHSAPGMDLVDLFCGSEGTLGVVVEAELRLVPAPEQILAGILFFASEERAFAFVDDARDRTVGAVAPMALEYFGRRALDLIRQDTGLPADAQVAILFEQDTTADGRDALVADWIELAARHEASDASWIAEEARDHRRFREFRHRVPVTINEILARR